MFARRLTRFHARTISTHQMSSTTSKIMGRSLAPSASYRPFLRYEWLKATRNRNFDLLGVQRERGKPAMAPMADGKRQCASSALRHGEPRLSRTSVGTGQNEGRTGAKGHCYRQDWRRMGEAWPGRPCAVHERRGGASTCDLEGCPRRPDCAACPKKRAMELERAVARTALSRR
jgi:hypothetical protein